MFIHITYFIKGCACTNGRTVRHIILNSSFQVYYEGNKNGHDLKRDPLKNNFFFTKEYIFKSLIAT